MIVYLQGMYRIVGSSRNSPLFNAIYLYIEQESATIEELAIWIKDDLVAGYGDAKFQVYVNGVAVFAVAPVDLRPVIPVGERKIEVTGLSVAVVKGDVITLDKLGSQVLITPLALQLKMEDGLSAGGGTVDSVVAGNNVTVDDTDPANPIVHAYGVVETVVAGTGITVDDTDPANPIVSASGGGGGGVLYPFIDPDHPYDTPNANDDEFDAGTLSAIWTAYNTPPTLNWDTPGHMRTTPTDNTNLRGWSLTTFSLTVGDSYAMKVRFRAGISSDDIKFGFITNWPDVHVNWRLAYVMNMTNHTFFPKLYRWSSNGAINTEHSIGVGGATVFDGVIYLRMDYYVAGKWKLYYSFDGIIWHVAAHDSFASPLASTPWIPTLLGMGIWGSGTTNGQVYVDWFRKLQGTIYGQYLEP